MRNSNHWPKTRTRRHAPEAHHAVCRMRARSLAGAVGRELTAAERDALVTKLKALLGS